MNPARQSRKRIRGSVEAWKRHEGEDETEYGADLMATKRHEKSQKSSVLAAEQNAGSSTTNEHSKPSHECQQRRLSWKGRGLGLKFQTEQKRPIFCPATSLFL